MAIIVRSETPADVASIRRVNEAAFQQPTEADLVDRLRAGCPDALSFVADVDGDTVGHVLFTPVGVECDGRRVVGQGLAPMAVQPDRQRQGVGSALVRRGLDELRARGCPFVVVVGHPGYYPRFGFVPASARGLRSQWEGMPDDVFMVRVFDEDAMSGVTGIVRYREEFEEVT